MKKFILKIVVCLCLPVYGLAQQFYFPRKAVTDSILLVNVMPDLAKKVIVCFKPENNQKNYLNLLFQLQMAAKEYSKAIETIKSLRTINREESVPFAELLNVQYELFSDVKLKQEVTKASFDEVFNQSFIELEFKLGDLAALNTASVFTTPTGISPLKRDLQVVLEKQTGKDSIDITTAITLCDNYNTLQVYRLIEPSARPLLREDDRRRYTVMDSVLIKTRDGAYISAIVVHKKGITAPQPVILQFTIYTGAVHDITRDIAGRGYIGMVAFTRGKRFSPNEVVPYEFDGRDCYDVINWVSKQPWCNGKVGMYGGSYTGFTQWAAAKHLHPALKTIVPSASAAPGLDVPMMNNVFENFVFPWIYYVSNNKYLDFSDYNNSAKWNDIDSIWYASGKPYNIRDSLTGKGKNKIFQSWIAHPSYDKYWRDMIPYQQDFSKINIPILTTTGYYDGGQVGAMYYFREHYKYNKNANQYLIIGPYSHYGSQGFVSTPDPEPIIGGYKIDPVANIHIHDIIFQWFDYILKGGKKPSILTDRVNYQVMGTNEWKHKHSLDKMNNDTLKFYLSDEPAEKDWRLTPDKPLKKEFLSEKVDFSDRKTSNTFYHADTIIYNKLDKSNGLVFVTDPLKKSVNINGRFFGQIKAVVNKKDMDYNVSLYELMPDGRYFYLSYFMGRASYAKDPGKRLLLHPGKMETMPFTNTYMTSRKINAGSRIVVVLSVNKSQDNQINYGTGKVVSNESIADAQLPLVVKWYNDSYIRIPVWK